MIEIITPELLFRHPSASVLIPALRTVGNIVTGDDMQTQVNSIGMLDLFLMFSFFSTFICILVIRMCVFTSPSHWFKLVYPCMMFLIVDSVM
jgi:hypothetical protein